MLRRPRSSAAHLEYTAAIALASLIELDTGNGGCWRTVSLRLALAPASDAVALGRFTWEQRRFFSSAALDTRGLRNQKLDPVSDLRPYDAKSDS